MISSGAASVSTGGVSIGTGVAGFLGLLFLILFFTVGQPFGTLNDVFIALTAILSGVMAWLFLPQTQARAPQLALPAVLLASAGALLTLVGAALVISGRAGWFLSGLWMSAGNALIGLWVLTVNYLALRGSDSADGVTLLGLGAGAIMVLGLAAVPGIFSRIDSWESAPWYVSYVGQAGALGYLLLFPIWCLVMGRGLIR